MFQYPIELITGKDIKEFVDIACTCEDSLYVKSGKLVGNAKSLLNMLVTVEWGDLILESEIDVATKFAKFIKKG